MAITEETMDLSIADSLAGIAAALQQATVQVRGSGPGGGSGVIWQPDGLVITNAHVARGPTATVELWDGRTFEGEVFARNDRRDLAAIAVQAADLPAAPIADSSFLRVGQLALAMGNPLGLTGALTVGIIHAITRAEDGGRWVQADVPLAPGNSGGPLADAYGRVIGINSMVAGGLGLAVPSNAVNRFLGNRGQRPVMGLHMQPVRVPMPEAGQPVPSPDQSGPNRGAVPGLMILEVEANSPAERAGLMVGDIILRVGGRILAELGDPRLAFLDLSFGETVQLDLLRGGTPITRNVILDPLADRPAGSKPRPAGPVPRGAAA